MTTLIWGCKADIDTPIAVTSISVTGEGSASSVEDGSTLQMSATVLPANATDKGITWSVANGTGTASISATGLLTATDPGTVTVKAVAKDGSKIQGIKTITITEFTGIASPLASFAALTLTQTGDVANNNVQYIDATAVIAALPAMIEVTLVNSTKKNIPLTWTDTDTYDAAVAGNYTFTATWGAMPAGANNANSLGAPAVELTVKAGVLLVTGITVTGTGAVSEVVLDDTLQMIATVLPLEASDPSITWSVVEGDGPGKGKATISTEGLLTGTVAGTVTVKATAKDGSAMEGTKEITVNSRPFVTITFPENLEEGVAITTLIEASFNEEMDLLTMIGDNFTVSVFEGSLITGNVSYDVETKTMTFDPDSDLLENTKYTAKVTTGVKDSSGLAMLVDKEWTFTTATAVLAGEGPALINLKSASNFAILAKTAVTTTGGTQITGDIGVSPAALTDLTGFSATLSEDGTSATSDYVTGKIYASDMQEPTPSILTTAITDVQAAYVEAAGRGDYAVTTGAHAGIIGGQTFAPGIYKWSTVVTMATDITLQGGPNDTWIFQVADNLTASSGAKVLLDSGAQAKNVFWQVAGIVTLGSGAHFEGIIMGQTQIILETGSSVHGKLFAQSQVTLGAATVTPL